ncbi:MAG: DUF6882 domain-containing protein [Planctomycetota bacterium]
MTPKLLSLFDQHAVETYDKQSRLNDLVGHMDWELSMDEGVLRFGDQYQWNVQVLGTESTESGTWLWAWGNQASEISEKLLTSANRLRELGKSKNISELCDPQLSTREHDGHFWATLATGLFKANAYYRAPYEAGAVYLMISDERYPSPNTDLCGRLRLIFPQAISSCPIRDHKFAFINYAQSLGLSVQEQDGTLSARDDEGNELLAEFDDWLRLIRLAGKSLPPAPTGPISTHQKKSSSMETSTIMPEAIQDQIHPTFFGNWLRNCRENFIPATLTWGAIAIVIGLAAWIFVSLQTAVVVGVAIFTVLWMIGFIETSDSTTPGQ